MAKPKEIELTREYLLELFMYDRESGKLFWKKLNPRARNVKAGAKAGYLNNRGYLVVKADGRLYLVHRLIWIIEHGSIDSSLYIDHLNGDRTDNRIENLRLVTARENQCNRKCHRDNTKSSKFVGVSWYKRHNKWRAGVRVNGKKKHLGYFNSEEEAAKAYQEALKNLKGKL